MPAYNPMLHQQQAAASAKSASMSPTQQQRQQQQPMSYSQAALRGGSGPTVRIQLPTEDRQGSSSSSSRAQTHDSGPDDAAGGKLTAGAQKPRQRRGGDPFSDLLHPDLHRKLSIHDRDLWSQHHRQGDL